MVALLCRTLLRGGCVVTMPSSISRISPVNEKHRAHAYIVPPVALALARHPLVDQFDLSSLEIVMSGAAAVGTRPAARARNDCGAASSRDME